MIHHGERLPLGFEPRDDLPGVHAQLDDLQRHTTADRLFLLGHIDHAEAAFADHLEQRVTANHRAGAFGNRRRHGGFGVSQTWQLAHIHGIPAEETFRFRRGAEQAFDALSHGGIALAGKVEVGGEFFRVRELAGGVVNGLFVRAGGVHNVVIICPFIKNYALFAAEPTGQINFFCNGSVERGIHAASPFRDLRRLVRFQVFYTSRVEAA